jgi:hypothetical protein
VLSAASAPGHTLTSAEFCGGLKSEFSTLIQNGGQPSTTSHVAPVVATFSRQYAADALSTSFDRTFAFIAMLTILGVIPALFLRRPERAVAEPIPHAA